MPLTRIEVISEESDVADLPLGDFAPNNQAIQIRNIDGLEPVKADVSTTGYATGRGEMSTGVSIPKRNIVLTFGLNPDWTDQSVTSLRHLLYHYFMPGGASHLSFYSTELPTVYIDGIVESVEPNIFSQDPEVQVSILCLKPDFIDVGSVDTTGSIISGTPEATIDYIGTVSTGFKLKILTPLEMYDFTGDFTVRNTVRGVDHDLYFNGVMVSPDMSILLETTRTMRYLRNVPEPDDGVTFISLYGAIQQGSEWPELLPGRNIIQVITEAVGLSFELSYINRFGGL